MLVGVTTPLGNDGAGPGAVDPKATPYLISSPPPIGLKIGATAPEFATTRRRRHDLPADRPRRQARSGSPTCAARPSGSTSGRRGARPASPRCRSSATVGALQGPGARARRDQRPGDLAGRRRGLRRPVPARLHDRLRRLRATIFHAVQGVRPADPGLHRPERGHPQSIVGVTARRGRRRCPGRGDPAGGGRRPSAESGTAGVEPEPDRP